MRTGCYVYRCFCTYVEFFTNSYFLGDENEEQGSYSINTAIVRPTILHCACILQLGPIIAATRKYLRRNFNNGKWVNGLMLIWSDAPRLWEVWLAWDDDGKRKIFGNQARHFRSTNAYPANCTNKTIVSRVSFGRVVATWSYLNRWNSCKNSDQWREGR